ncbi:class I SAM-dependent methyltransferase [Streptomyces sp. TLI_185]|uniref:methyltransferase n=1 Tax=Streptomyces sp. TLI_185 TaxID=2485151 RepID=UPI000F5006E5|nr:class I SAM-dependent methyltransferase [Streptomyces sp. TLI_185]RPF24887.1 methylase of polypeptide subunit release factors [Streptomyces sp. TLI_185]
MTDIEHQVTWTDTEGRGRTALWHSENAAVPPRRIVLADDRIKADAAYHIAAEGTAMLWCGDFHNARQLLSAMKRRIDRRRRRPAEDSAIAFNQYRQAQAFRAKVLGSLLVAVDEGAVLSLRRSPDIRTACAEAGCPLDRPFVCSLTALLGMTGAHEWRRKGVKVPALGGARIHPHYGVFSPVRGEYVDLVAQAPLPDACSVQPVAFDIGTGTGVLATVLARRGMTEVVATDLNPRALACAQENVERLGLTAHVRVAEADLFPARRRAALVVCNPPWLPAKPTSTLESAVYDPGSRMLREFLRRLPGHLEPGGEGWLILSDLAEHLGLRTRDDLLDLFAAAGLEVVGRLDARPHHPKADDPADPLHAARSREVTSLWRLAVKAR